MRRSIIASFTFAVSVLFAAAAHAADKLKPFVLASTGPGDVAAAVEQAKAKLSGAGFEVVGSYSPYDTAAIIVVTNDALKANAAKSDFGGFGAIQRVSVTKVDGQVQVAYTNPQYMANVYRMKGDLKDVSAAMAAALGNTQTFGPDEGLEPSKLREYHYKFMMPYFDDVVELASYADHNAAVAAVDKALTAGTGGVSKVYRVDVPGSNESVFGVHMTNDCSADKYIMERIDFKKLRSTGHLPYEVLVHGSKVYTLPAEFRIAINFPDLSMIGSNSFASIMCAPDAIKTALTKATGGETKDSLW